MRQCSNLPLYQYEGIKCNGSAKPFVNNTPTNNSCVNWNQYYTVCEASDKNPFQGAISFDNIGLAWVAIFQVGSEYLIEMTAMLLIFGQSPYQCVMSQKDAKETQNMWRVR